MINPAPELNVRLATLDDAAAIARVHIDAWRTTYAHLLPSSFLASLSHKEREETWIRTLGGQDSQEFTFVAGQPGRGIVGFATGGPERDGLSGYSGELRAIYLLRTAQRVGIGRQLVAAVAGRLADAGHESMMVWVLAENPSRGFYERLGGRPVAEKLIEWAGVQLIEVALGWPDLGCLK